MSRWISWNGSGLLTFLAFAVAACGGGSPRVIVPLLLVDRVESAEKSFDRSTLLSYRKNGLLAGSFTLRGETRQSIAPLLPSELTFKVDLPENPILRFGMAVLAPNEEMLPARVGFRVDVETGQGRETVFRAEVRRYQPNVWIDQALDLNRWAGQSIRLVLETQPEASPGGGIEPNQMIPLWGNPVIDGDAAEEPARNVFLISLDCVRADHVGAYGYERDTTPHLDRLAAESVVFETAVAAAPETLPAHMSMLTGLPPSLHGASKWTRAPDSLPYLPEILAKNGYEVSGLVTGAFLSQPFGFQRGFHRYRFIDRPGARETVDAALELLSKTNRKRQFFLLHLFDAHWPYLPPRDLVDRFGPRPRDISDLMEKLSQQDYRPESPEEIRQFVNLYDATLVEMDRELARFFDELERRKLLDDALVVVLGDHGEAFYEHGWWQHTFTLYEEMTRIPLIVHWPKGALHGSAGAPAGQVDLFPTILAYAGIAPPDNEGVDLRELAERKEVTRDLVSEAGWRSAGRYFWKVGIRSSERKYTVSFEGEADDGWPPATIASEELYELGADENERNNRAASSPTALGPFRQKARAYVDRVQATLATRQTEGFDLDEALKERLRSLGYTVY